jgi:hypothetical protein
MGPELLGTLSSERRIEPATLVDCGELIQLESGFGGELSTFPVQIGALGVRLRADGYVLARSHRHRSGDQTRQTGDENLATRGAGRCDTNHQTGRRPDAIVGPEHRST